MPRLTKLDEVLFPVDEHPVFVSFPDPEGQALLPVPEKKAIVHQKTRRVLGVVSRNYKLVTNQQALEMADQCCRTVFPETNSGEWEVTAVDAPGTAGHCYLDLVHNSARLDFSGVSAKDRPDVFGPFIRVTNSYNALRALSFDIGFYRKVCKNGLILPGTVITFRFSHVRREIGETIEFRVDQGRLVQLKSSFSQFLGSLRSCEVPRPLFAPLIHGVLCLKEPEQEVDRKGPEWSTLSGHLTEMSNRYGDDLGNNAYAVFNVITEFASHPPHNRFVRRDRHSMQRLAGSWLNAFSQECRKPAFSLEAYLKALASSSVNAEEPEAQPQ